MKAEWKRLRELKADADEIEEQKTDAVAAIKELREEVEALIADGSKTKDWKALRSAWEKLDRRDAERKELAKELKDLRGRMAALVKGGDASDDGQTNISDRLTVTLEAGGESVTLPAKDMDKALKQVTEAAARKSRLKGQPPKPEAA